VLRRNSEAPARNVWGRFLKCSFFRNLSGGQRTTDNGQLDWWWGSGDGTATGMTNALDPLKPLKLLKPLELETSSGVLRRNSEAPARNSWGRFLKCFLLEIFIWGSTDYGQRTTGLVVGLWLWNRHWQDKCFGSSGTFGTPVTFVTSGTSVTFVTSGTSVTFVTSGTSEILSYQGMLNFFGCWKLWKELVICNSNGCIDAIEGILCKNIIF